MSEVRWTAAFGLLDFLLDVTVVAARPVLRTRFGALLILPSTDGLAAETLMTTLPNLLVGVISL
jgi:hypothetical protein